MRDISFGQYYPVKSFVHNIDARIRDVAVYDFGIFYRVVYDFCLHVCAFNDNNRYLPRAL